MSQVVPLTIRTLHILAMAVVVGGTVVCWYGFRSDSIGDLALARRYEWAFWAALGTLVLTGVGNLGSLGVPGPATEWGRTLLVKLSLVVVLLCVSVVRTLSVVRAEERLDEERFEGEPSDDPIDPTALRRYLGRAYAVTFGFLLVIVVLAEVLAHG